MNDRDDIQGSDAVEALLEKAAPRPAPPADVEREIRAAVRDEWEAIAGVARTRRRVGGFALAASVLVAVAAAFTMLGDAGESSIEVASLSRSHGSIILAAQQTGEVTTEPFTTLTAGQVLSTAASSAAGLAWNHGGSLRVDEDSRVEFVSADEIFLHQGRVYFDSDGMSPDTRFIVRTAHGSVSHVGTQFMTESVRDGLVISVREGRVDVEGAYHDHTATEGQVVELSGRARPRVTQSSGAGGEWKWIEAVAPAVDLQGKSTYDFLRWVGRETGHTVVFATDAAEQLALNTEFIGDIHGNPRDDLMLWMLTTDLDAQFDSSGPSIIVSVSR